jgi:hypothetical protein
MAARNWTPEQRRQQAEKIRAWSPWAKATGPRSDEGKARASRNAWMGGCRITLRELAQALARQRQSLEGK